MSFYKHGLSCVGDKTYQSWQSMKQRCFNPKHHNYKKYGAKGITVCDRWKASFENFFIDMGHRPAGCSLDRINNTGNYEPSNCRWATPEEQIRNRKCTVWIKLRGKHFTLNELSKLTGIRRKTLWARLNAGWTVEELVNTPLEKWM